MGIAPRQHLFRLKSFRTALDAVDGEASWMHQLPKNPAHIQTSDQVSETDVFDSVPAFARCTYVRGSGGVRGSKGREGRREVGSPTKKSWIDDISGVAGAGDDVDEPLDRPAFEASGVLAIDSLLGANSGDMLPSLLISPVHLGSDQAVLPRHCPLRRSACPILKK